MDKYLEIQDLITEVISETADQTGVSEITVAHHLLESLVDGANPFQFTCRVTMGEIPEGLASDFALAKYINK